MKSKLKIIIPIGIALIAIVLAFVFIRFAPAKTTDIGAMISTAQQYLTEQKYEQAIAEFQKIIEIDPKNADAYIGLAKAYIGIGDTDKAVEVLEDGYEQTNDDRILEMLEELKSGEETAETTVTTVETTEETVTTAGMKIIVPDLEGLSKEEAIELCEKVGLKYAISESESYDVEKDHVISQQVTAGSEVDERTTILFTVSKGTNLTTTSETTVSETTSDVITTTDAKIRKGVESGQCGENVNYTLDKNGTLYVYGTGDMFDYSWSYINNDYHIDGVEDYVVAEEDSSNCVGIDGSYRPVNYWGEPSPFGGNDKIKHLVIEKGVTSIGNSTFVYCYNLEDISLADTVKTIGKSAFNYCVSLDINKIPSTVITINDSAFENCSSLKQITLCSETIKRYAFAYCENIEKVLLTKDVKRIGRGSFCGLFGGAPKKVIIQNPDCLFYLDTEPGFEDEVFHQDTILYGYSESTAEKYANEFGRTFKALAE